jgi:hypothetical protein
VITKLHQVANAATDRNATAAPIKGPADAAAFLPLTRAAMSERFGPNPTGAVERLAAIVAKAIPEVADLARQDRLNLGLVEELCQLPESAQREIVAQPIGTIRRVARSCRALRLHGVPSSCLCCGRRFSSVR